MIYLQSWSSILPHFWYFRARDPSPLNSTTQCHTFSYSCFRRCKRSKYATEKVKSWAFPTSIHDKCWVFSTHGKYDHYGMGIKPVRDHFFIPLFGFKDFTPSVQSSVQSSHVLFRCKATIIAILGSWCYFSVTGSSSKERGDTSLTSRYDQYAQLILIEWFQLESEAGL